MTNTFVFRPINMKATGRRIRDCRTARNLTVEQLSTLFCISPQAVCKWQRGDALPTIDNLMVLCDLFQVKVEDLIVRDDDGSSVFLSAFACNRSRRQNRPHRYFRRNRYIFPCVFL